MTSKEYKKGYTRGKQAGKRIRTDKLLVEINMLKEQNNYLRDVNKLDVLNLTKAFNKGYEKCLKEQGEPK